MRVMVLDRMQATTYCRSTNPFETVMISISTPGIDYWDEPFISPENKIRGILRLCFDDVDTPDRGQCMVEKDAQLVAEFLRMHPEKDVIVHCDAGMSRSAGVAAAILKWATGNDRSIFKDHWYHPNMLCYRLTLNSLMEVESNG